MPATKSKRPSDRQKTKLRASCDGCYLSKIKCNKARPMCSRCLTYGIDCIYSPSSRSGRAKRDQDRYTSNNDYEPDASALSQEQTEDESHPGSRPEFLYISRANLSVIDPEYNFNQTTLTRDLETTVGKYSPFGEDVAVSGTETVPSVTTMEPFDSDFWWTDPDAPATKQGNDFSGSNMLPITSDFLLSSPPDLWNQFSNDQLDFTSYNTPDIHFNPCHSPATSVSIDPPHHSCNCFASYCQDPGSIHNHTCPNFQPGL